MIQIELPNNGSHTFRKCLSRSMGRQTALYNCEELSANDVMFYFEQFSALSFPEKMASVLLCPMVYIPRPDAQQNESVFTATHVSRLINTNWEIMCAIWISRCGKTHVLTLSNDLTMRLMDISNNNIYRDYVALPKVVVNIPEVIKIVRLFMTHQGKVCYAFHCYWLIFYLS